MVPILAPITMPNACFSVISPAFTKPTVMTVVALLDCKTAVTAAPNATPTIKTPVNASSIFCNFSPAARCRPSPINCMPYKNNARPPRKPKKYTIIAPSSHLFILYLTFIILDFTTSLQEKNFSAASYFTVPAGLLCSNKKIPISK